MSPEVKSISTAPETSAVVFPDGNRMFVGWARYGNRAPFSKVFFHKGLLPSAIERYKKHCDEMNYRFCGCYPFAVDLDVQEKSKNDEMGFTDHL